MTYLVEWFKDGQWTGTNAKKVTSVYEADAEAWFRANPMADYFRPSPRIRVSIYKDARRLN